MSSQQEFDTTTALATMEQAGRDGLLTPGAVENIRVWLTEPRYADYAPQVAEHIAAGQWQILDDVFWTIIPFGTGGRRGKMYPIGSNAINDRTIGESAQGLADYVKEQHTGDGELACGIAYDTRHRSREFAELCAEVMVAAGFKVYFLDGYRSTPELSFLVRHKKCACGIMVTASHNPPSDNAVKAYWSTGGQLLPPHDSGVINRVMTVSEIHRQPFAAALAAGQVEYCQDEVDAGYLEQLMANVLPGPRELKILYSPMHGVGASSIMPTLTGMGFKDVEIFGPHATPDGDFPNVPNHVSNPENPATFDSMIEHAETNGTELILSTDPDADRLGCAARVTAGGPWKTLTGNQIGALITEYLLSQKKKAGQLTKDHYLIKTLVTTELVRRIGDQYGVTTYGDLLVGFKWIGGLMDEVGPAKFLLGTEESHGYLTGTYARDKDAASGAVLLAGLAAELKTEGKTLHEKLDEIFIQYGAHAEHTISVTMPGSEGMARMKTLMEGLRTNPPAELAGYKLVRVRDYENACMSVPGSADSQPLTCQKGDMVIFDLETEGNYIAVRPSGTEPKVKFYLFAYEAPEEIADIGRTKKELQARIERFQQAVTEYAHQQ